VTDAVAQLKKVDYLSALDDGTLAEMAAGAQRRCYVNGEVIVSELESGSEVFVITGGEAEVSVDGRVGERKHLGKLGPGSAFGEMSSLTGELRSATVTALGDVEVLIISDADFDRFRERRPEIALALVRILAARLAEAEKAIDALFSPSAAVEEKSVEKAVGTDAKGRRGSIGRVWRELVVGRQRDLTFLTLVAFVGAIMAVRFGVYASFRFDFAPRLVLRTAYMTGFALLIGSGCASLLTNRPGWRRAIAVAYGVGVALIFNELGVTLAFDIFYKDIHTADPNVPFDIERLYRRTEPLRAIAIGLVVLIQAAYLRRFYVRAAFVIMTRLRRFSSKSSPGV
jgi:CRP-like cAMP-binding protein